MEWDEVKCLNVGMEMAKAIKRFGEVPYVTDGKEWSHRVPEHLPPICEALKTHLLKDWNDDRLVRAQARYVDEMFRKRPTLCDSSKLNKALEMIKEMGEVYDSYANNREEVRMETWEIVKKANKIKQDLKELELALFHFRGTNWQEGVEQDQRIPVKLLYAEWKKQAEEHDAFMEKKWKE